MGELVRSEVLIARELHETLPAERTPTRLPIQETWLQSILYCVPAGIVTGVGTFIGAWLLGLI